MTMQWYYQHAGQQLGPVSPGQLKQCAASGQLQPTDLVWKEGLANWVPAGKVKGLFPSTVTGSSVQPSAPGRSIPTSPVARPPSPLVPPPPKRDSPATAKAAPILPPAFQSGSLPGSALLARRRQFDLRNRPKLIALAVAGVGAAVVVTVVIVLTTNESAPDGEAAGQDGKQVASGGSDLPGNLWPPAREPDISTDVAAGTDNGDADRRQGLTSSNSLSQKGHSRRHTDALPGPCQPPPPLPDPLKRWIEAIATNEEGPRLAEVKKEAFADPSEESMRALLNWYKWFGQRCLAEYREPVHCVSVTTQGKHFLKEHGWTANPYMMNGSLESTILSAREPENVPLFIKALEDRDPRMRTLAARVLGSMGDTRAVEPLRACLKDGENWNYFVACALFQLTGNEKLKQEIVRRGGSAENEQPLAGPRYGPKAPPLKKGILPAKFLASRGMVYGTIDTWVVHFTSVGPNYHHRATDIGNPKAAYEQLSRQLSEALQRKREALERELTAVAVGREIVCHSRLGEMELTEESKAEMSLILLKHVDFGRDPMMAAITWETLIFQFPPEAWADQVACLKYRTDAKAIGSALFHGRVKLEHLVQEKDNPLLADICKQAFVPHACQVLSQLDRPSSSAEALLTWRVKNLADGSRDRTPAEELGLYYINTGQLDKAMPLVEKYGLFTPLVSYYIRKGQLDKAMPLAKKYSVFAPLVSYYIRKGQLDKGVQLAWGKFVFEPLFTSEKTNQCWTILEPIISREVRNVERQVEASRFLAKALEELTKIARSQKMGTLLRAELKAAIARWEPPVKRAFQQDKELEREAREYVSRIGSVRPGGLIDHKNVYVRVWAVKQCSSKQKERLRVTPGFERILKAALQDNSRLVRAFALLELRDICQDHAASRKKARGLVPLIQKLVADEGTSMAMSEDAREVLKLLGSR